MSDEEKRPETAKETTDAAHRADAVESAGDGSESAGDASACGARIGATEDESPVPEESPGKIAGDKTERSRKRQKKEAAAETEGLEAELSRLNEETEALRSEVRDLKDKWLRSVADLDNFRKRVRKEWDLLHQRAAAETVLGVLPVVDDFERAFSVVGERDDDFIRGIRLIYNKLAATLEEAGVQKIEALGAIFDPNYHMAVAQVERERAISNQVVEVVQQGYSLGDIVIRPARVVIAK